MTSAVPSRRGLALAALLVTAGVLGGGALAAGAATPGPSPSAASTAAEDERTPADEAAAKAAREAAKAARKAGRTAPAAGGPAPSGPAFVCDPALSHGQNVSAYARSLPKGPGRGRLVSQAARSDCGTTASDD